MCKTWPTIDSLLRPYSGLPEPLVATLRQRYDEHAFEYATAEMRDGLPVNDGWNANTFTNLEEELVDAIFNGLMLAKKMSAEVGKSNLTEIYLSELVEIWEKLQMLREELVEVI